MGAGAGAGAGFTTGAGAGVLGLEIVDELVRLLENEELGRELEDDDLETDDLETDDELPRASKSALSINRPQTKTDSNRFT